MGMLPTESALTPESSRGFQLLTRVLLPS